MNYSINSFVALSPVKKAGSTKPGPSKQTDAVASADAFTLTGSARISRIEDLRPWYARAFQRLLGRRHVPEESGVKLEVFVGLGGAGLGRESTGLPELWSHLGVTSGIKRAVIQISVEPAEDGP